MNHNMNHTIILNFLDNILINIYNQSLIMKLKFINLYKIYIKQCKYRYKFILQLKIQEFYIQKINQFSLDRFSIQMEILSIM